MEPKEEIYYSYTKDSKNKSGEGVRACKRVLFCIFDKTD
jgi:hypothetical protein